MRFPFEFGFMGEVHSPVTLRDALGRSPSGQRWADNSFFADASDLRSGRGRLSADAVQKFVVIMLVLVIVFTLVATFKGRWFR
jgi:hypothetical protein